MKKIEYQAPEMEIIEVELEKPLLDVSGKGAVNEGTGDAEGY